MALSRFSGKGRWSLLEVGGEGDLWGSLPIFLRWCRLSVIVVDRRWLDPQDEALICGGGFKRIWLTSVSECTVSVRGKSSLFLLRRKFLVTKALDCIPLSFTGECGARFRQHFWPEYHEYGEGSRVPAGRWVRRTVGELPVHRLLFVCCRPGIPGSQSYLSRLVSIRGER